MIITKSELTNIQKDKLNELKEFEKIVGEHIKIKLIEQLNRLIINASHNNFTMVCKTIEFKLKGTNNPYEGHYWLIKHSTIPYLHGDENLFANFQIPITILEEIIKEYGKENWKLTYSDAEKFWKITVEI